MPIATNSISSLFDANPVAEHSVWITGRSLAIAARRLENGLHGVGRRIW